MEKMPVTDSASMKVAEFCVLKHKPISIFKVDMKPVEACICLCVDNA